MVAVLNPDLRNLIHKANCEATQKERNEWNKFQRELWNISDQLRGISHFPSAEEIGGGRMPQLCRDLHNLIASIPLLEK